jgi:type III restriction enzyme
MQTLYQILNTFLKSGDPDFYKVRVPEFIYNNLKKNFGKRSYQKEAFGRFIFYWNEYVGRPKGIPTQLLYHMATGSGKTLIMAGLIIYLYSKGYRNFLFFVNSTNIIDKTRDNFLNSVSSKYLFAENILIEGKQIRIKEVNNFQAANPDNINIVFSTIQGLHSRLNTPKENSITYDDFEDKEIVLISDEAHHINAETKKGNELKADEREEIISWEGTVSRIFNANKDNVLLEFTATADLSLPEIEKKYNDKIIYDYPLKQFRRNGYSKEVKVMQADLSPFERALQGIILSQYRQKLFEKYKKFIKPVILFKSRTIKESQFFFNEFISGIKNLRASDLQKIKDSNLDNALQAVFQYLDENNITLENFAAELKEDFSEDKLISVNSKDESEQKQLAVNSLEEETNPYRAIFAVDKLNEGWDVLNLFDIVRLYDIKAEKTGRPGKTTMSEAQLIGRGARYCPFKIIDSQPMFNRKFDDEPENELRICEELYYHSTYNPKYIRELNIALEEIGIKAKDKEDRIINPANQFPKKTGPKEKISFLKLTGDQTFNVTLKTGEVISGAIFNTIYKEEIKIREQHYKLVDFGEIIVRKAMSKLPFYQFSNLKNIWPELHSVSEFIASPEYLGEIRLKVSGFPEQINDLSPKQKLEASIDVLQDVASVFIREYCEI